MKFLQIIFYLFCVLCSTLEVVKGQAYNEVDLEDDFENTLEFPQKAALEKGTSEFLLSWQLRRALQRLIEQMPCGWPSHNIPPLAPFVYDNFTWHSSDNSVKLNSYVNFHPIRIDGLNDIEIDKLSVSYIFKKIFFTINFRNITASGNFNLSNFLNLKTNNTNSEYELKGTGALDFSLLNLQVVGAFRFKLPWLFGNAKIYNLKLLLTLEKVHSNLTGVINQMQIDQKLNSFIENTVLDVLHDYEDFINIMISHTLEQRLNQQLNGQTLWNIIWSSLDNKEVTCAPELLQIYEEMSEINL